MLLKAKSIALAALFVPAALAGDIWEFASTSAGLDGMPLPFTHQTCLPAGGMDPAQVLGGAGFCTFDEKRGDPSAMTFSMTCKTPGMPAGLDSMQVSGEARLGADRFDMRYTITIGGNKAAPGSDFRMTGSVRARKVGPCSER